MGYVIYNKETTVILRISARSAGCYKESFKSESAAKAALTRQDKKGKLGDRVTQYPTKENNFTRETVPHVKEDFAIAEAVDFHNNIEKSVEKTNLMSGKPYMERINTPACVSPASERYWSM